MTGPDRTTAQLSGVPAPLLSEVLSGLIERSPRTRSGSTNTHRAIQSVLTRVRDFFAWEAHRCTCRTSHRPLPNLRTHVPPVVIEHWRAQGWTIHQVGQAVYAHDPENHLHLLLGVWPRRSPAPSWAGRLGHVSEGYRRRYERRWNEEHDPADLRPWWQWPQPRVYSWDGQP